METFTITEAAEATGLTKKAIRNRVDRGQLRAVLRDGVRRIPKTELERIGLPTTDGAAVRQGQPHAASEVPSGDSVIKELLDRLERQAGEVARLRALTERAESLEAEYGRLQTDLFEAKARISELEQRRRWFRLGRAA